MAAGKRLVVELVAAKGLIPEDYGQSATNVYCTLEYDDQQKKTGMKPKDSNPAWNEKFEFTLLEYTSPDAVVTKILEINLQIEHSSSGIGRQSSSLG